MDCRDNVRVFEKIADGLEPVRCPLCSADVFVFRAPKTKPLVVDRGGDLHYFSCPGLTGMLDFYHSYLECQGTTYDNALLRANGKFCPPFL